MPGFLVGMHVREIKEELHSLQVLTHTSEPWIFERYATWKCVGHSLLRRLPLPAFLLCFGLIFLPD
jgi:hypothetical protein